MRQRQIHTIKFKMKSIYTNFKKVINVNWSQNCPMNKSQNIHSLMIHHGLNMGLVTILFPITYFVNDSMNYIEMFLDLDFFLKLLN